MSGAAPSFSRIACFAGGLATAVPLACGSVEPAAPVEPVPQAEPIPQHVPQAPAAPLTLSPISTTRPMIPDEVCQQRLSGWVELDFAVMPDGKVAEVVVTAAEPTGAFEAAAAASVAEWTYAPQPEPVRMHVRLPMSQTDCRTEQLREPDVASVAPRSPEQCQAVAAEAKAKAERFASADSGRAVLKGERAQVYTAPGVGCHVAGREFKAGVRLTAYAEYGAFTLVNVTKRTEESAVWVWSSRLKDVDP